MIFKQKLSKIGDSYYLLVPKALIDVFGLSEGNYIYEVIVSDEGDTITYKKIGEEVQTKIDDFKKPKRWKKKK